MAQSGYTPIVLFHSTTTGNVPTTSNLAVGELAINNTDGKLFYNTGSAIAVLAGAGGAGIAGGSNTQVQYNSSGSLAGSANMTFSGTALTLANDASISGLTVGKGGGAVSTNTAVGASAMAATASGGNNTAYGYQAGNAITSGNNTTFIGTQAGLAATTSEGSVGVGSATLYATTTGSFNVAVGQQALRFNTTASNNTAVGYQSLYTNTTGAGNIGLGYKALYANTTASYNTAIGYNAGSANTTGSITAVGTNALLGNTTGNSNTAVGGYDYTGQAAALQSNTTGSFNTALGTSALQANTTASNNTAVGYQAGYSGTTATQNVLLGVQAGYNLTTGSYNTFCGYAAGFQITTGAKNTIIGQYGGNQGGLDIRTASNYIVLSDGDGNPRIITDGSGRTLFGAASFLGSRNSQVGIDINGKDDALFIQNYGSGIGFGISMRPSSSSSGGNGDCINFTNTSFTTVGSIKTTSSATAYNTSSDYRLKENVAPMTGALNIVAQLKPVTYKWKIDGKDGQGFIAHELQAVVPDCVSGEKDAVDKNGNPDYQGVDASFLVATLTAAIQELNAKVEAQALEIAQLKGK